MHEGHDPDDGAEHERFWSEGFKEVIRQHVGQKVTTDLLGEKAFINLYQERYGVRYKTFEDFARRIGEMVTIGAENGADDAFDEINGAFLGEAPLPYPRRYARYSWPEAFSEETKKELRVAVVEEYGKDKAWQSIYQEHYANRYPNYADLIQEVAGLVVLGAVNGADDMLGKIYGAFLDARPLPVARRYPKRLRAW
jgi:hypothetical protein